MQTQTCSACRRAALSAGDEFPPLLQIWCAESPEFSADVSNGEKHRQERPRSSFPGTRAPGAGGSGLAWAGAAIPRAVAQASLGPGSGLGTAVLREGLAGGLCCGTCHLAGGQGASRGAVPRVGRRWEGK